jgi:hypothetical protein
MTISSRRETTMSEFNAEVWTDAKAALGSRSARKRGSKARKNTDRKSARRRLRELYAERMNDLAKKA